MQDQLEISLRLPAKSRHEPLHIAIVSPDAHLIDETVNTGRAPVEAAPIIGLSSRYDWTAMISLMSESFAEEDQS